MSIQLPTAVISLALLVAITPAKADSVTHTSPGSANMSAASGTVVAGSGTLIAGSGQLLVGSVEMAADSAIVVLRGASEAGTVSLRISREIAAATSLAVGTVIQVTAESVGYALSAGGKLIAFVPNEIGGSLLYHSQYQRKD